MLAVAVPLVLAFLLTAFFIDYMVSSLADEAQAARIEQQMLSLVALTRLDHEGRVDAARLANLGKDTFFNPTRIGWRQGGWLMHQRVNRGTDMHGVTLQDRNRFITAPSAGHSCGPLCLQSRQNFWSPL